MSGQIKTTNLYPSLVARVVPADKIANTTDFASLQDAIDYIESFTLSTTLTGLIMLQVSQVTEAITITKDFYTIDSNMHTVISDVTINIPTPQTVGPDNYDNAFRFKGCVFDVDYKLTTSAGGVLENCHILDSSNGITTTNNVTGGILFLNCNIGNIQLTDFTQASGLNIYQMGGITSGSHTINAGLYQWWGAIIYGDLNLDPGDSGGAFQFYNTYVGGNISGGNVLAFYGSSVINDGITINQSVNFYGGNYYQGQTLLNSGVKSVAQAVFNIENQLARASAWRPIVTKSYTDFSTAALTNTIDITPIETGESIDGIVLQFNAGENFSGAGITTYTIEILGPGGTPVLTTPFEVSTGGGSTAIQTTNLLYVASIGGGASSLRIRATSNVNLNNATQGVIRCWFRSSKLA